MYWLCCWRRSFYTKRAVLHRLATDWVVGKHRDRIKVHWAPPAVLLHTSWTIPTSIPSFLMSFHETLLEHLARISLCKHHNRSRSHRLWINCNFFYPKLTEKASKCDGNEMSNRYWYHFFVRERQNKKGSGPFGCITLENEIRLKKVKKWKSFNDPEKRKQLFGGRLERKLCVNIWNSLPNTEAKIEFAVGQEGGGKAHILVTNDATGKPGRTFRSILHLIIALKNYVFIHEVARGLKMRENCWIPCMHRRLTETRDCKMSSKCRRQPTTPFAQSP